jgi:hypothetical protein
MSFSQGTWGASDIVAVSSGTAFPICRALLVGTAGTATVITANGSTATDIPLQAGYNPIQVSKVTLGTASDVWALY